MQVHRDIDHLPVFRKAVITIGTFDGVHTGHRQVIQQLKKEASAIGGETVLITFHPHPRKVVSASIPGFRLINTQEEKTALLEQQGIDHLVVVPFTDAFAHQTADDYIRDFIVKKINPAVLVIGYDHRFGRDRKGDYRLLEKISKESGFRLMEISRQMLDEITISSTRIREALVSGEVEKANRLLGYEFFFSGTVVAGDRLGTKLGYPTANLEPDDAEKLIPADGIYAVYVRLNKTASRLKGMMSIGFRPTVNGQKRVVEVNIFDFDQDLYKQKLTVYVKKFLRLEKKFDNLQDLVSQMSRDKTESLKIL